MSNETELKPSESGDEASGDGVSYLMPKLYVYFGIVVFFYANEHAPVHVHGEYQGRESRAEIIIRDGEIVEIRFGNVVGRKPLAPKQLADFKTLVKHEGKNIVKSWVDFFVFSKPVKMRTITRKLK